MVILLTVNKENNIFTKKDKLEKKKGFDGYNFIRIFVHKNKGILTNKTQTKY